MDHNKKNRKKYLLTCKAPSELTQYNKEWNKKVEEECKQDPLYEPTLDCLGCKYLKIKGF